MAKFSAENITVRAGQGLRAGLFSYCRSYPITLSQMQQQLARHTAHRYFYSFLFPPFRQSQTINYNYVHKRDNNAIANRYSILTDTSACSNRRCQRQQWQTISQKSAEHGAPSSLPNPRERLAERPRLVWNAWISGGLLGSIRTDPRHWRPRGVSKDG